MPRYENVEQPNNDVARQQQGLEQRRMETEQILRDAAREGIYTRPNPQVFDRSRGLPD